MNKSVIAIAVTGILAAPFAAQAETTVFGKVHMSAGMIEETDSTQTPTTVTDNAQLRSHASRLGVKGEHDLGEGMKAKYHIEFEVNPDSDNKGSTAGNDGTAGLKRRNQWAGIGAGWGEVRVGRHDTPLKMAQGKFDQFNDTDADISGHYKISQGDLRLDNVIAYIGKFDKLTVAAAFQAGEGDGKKTADGGTGTGDSLADTTSIAVSYKAGPLFVSAAMDNYDNTEGQETDSLSRVVATYKIGAIQLGALVESGGNGGKSADKDVSGVSFGMGLGQGKIKAQYVTGKNNATTATEETQSSVGYDMKLSKQVTGYVMYTTAEEKTGTAKKEYTFTGAGLIVKF
jgi:predicted porin